jgi:signal transduction histidine kinase
MDTSYGARDHPRMESAPEAVEAPSAAPRERVSAGYNALVGAIARIPVPIRAKQLLGSVLIAALLALVAVLGLVALGQSNSRGTELRRLQQQGGYEQLLLTDATQLKQLIDLRLGSPDQLDDRPSRSDEPDLQHFDPASYERGFLSALDQQIGNEFTRLCLDAGVAPAETPGVSGCPVQNSWHQTPPHLPLTLHAVAPSLYRKLEGVVVPLGTDAGRPLVSPNSAFNAVSLFFMVSGASGYPQGPYQPFDVRADRWAASFAAKLAALTGKTRARATALVASDRRSYSRSRDLLIGAGAASLLLALALGLLLSDSVLVPLRKTQRRLAAIAAGDFSGHVEVPNRDEIGALAADVNRMSDELGRLYQELDTANKALEVANRELELASANKSAFLANMSHELRTPLNAVIGFSDVLHEQMFGELNERQLGYVEDIRAAGQHQLSLINDILDLAKIEAGRLELELSEVDVPNVLRGAVSMHSERARRGGIELVLSTEPDEIVVVADARCVRQVVFNLLSNAVKFTPTQGRVEISARIEDGHVEVAVVDTGHGIPPDELETIFQEFEQTAEGMKTEGTGLGLPLSRKLVELHGGRLWVESEVGRGSTFRFTLPVEQQT